ncbi:unnamed protein product [Closterium sp. NIES-54]
MLEKIGESLKETHFTATTVDCTKLPIHGKASLQLHIGALRWKPKLPIKNIKGLDFILGRGFLKRFNPEIDWVNWKACIYNNGNQVELRSWTDTFLSEVHCVFEAGPTVALLADQDGRQLSPHDGVPYQLRLLQVLSDAVRTLQRTDGVLGRDESHPTAPAGRVRGGVSGRHSHLLLEHEGARGAFAEILRDPAGEQVLREAVDSEFTLKKVQFLRHMVSVEGVHVDPRKIEAVKKWKVPENVKELQLLQQVRATVL